MGDAYITRRGAPVEIRTYFEDFIPNASLKKKIDKVSIGSEDYLLRAPRGYGAGVAFGPYIVFAGGSSSLMDIYECEYDRGHFVINKRWEDIGFELIRYRIAGAASADFAVFAGGVMEGQVTDVVECLDQNLSISYIDNLSMPRMDIASADCEFQGLMYFIGGNRGTDDAYDIVDTIDVFDYNLVRNSTSDSSVDFIGAAAIVKGNWIDEYSTEEYVVFGGGYVNTYFMLLDNGVIIGMQHNEFNLGDYTAAASAGKYAVFAGGLLRNQSTASKKVVAVNHNLVAFEICELDDPTYHMAAASFDDCAVFAGGYVGGINKNVSNKVFQINGDLIQTFYDHLDYGRAHMAAAAHNDYLLFGGGSNETYDTKQLDIYKNRDYYSMIVPKGSDANYWIDDGFSHSGGTIYDIKGNEVDMAVPINGYITYKYYGEGIRND